jgi:hypothetical protein
LIGIYFSYRVADVTASADAATVFAFKDQAWRRIFWVSLPPGILFVLGSFVVSESPRWLFRRGRREAALAALLRSRAPERAATEISEMEETLASEKVQLSAGARVKESLLHRKYVIPFVLACVILFCNTATGINSIIGYNTNILLQSGLSDVQAHWGYVIFTLVNFLLTMGGMLLVDRKGRKFLLILGTSGIIVSLTITGLLFLRQAAGRPGPCGGSDRRQPRLASRDLFLRRFFRGDKRCALRRSGSSRNQHHACKLRAREQAGGILQEPVCECGCRPYGSVKD